MCSWSLEFLFSFDAAASLVVSFQSYKDNVGSLSNISWSWSYWMLQQIVFQICYNLASWLYLGKLVVLAEPFTTPRKHGVTWKPSKQKKCKMNFHFPFNSKNIRLWLNTIIENYNENISNSNGRIFHFIITDQWLRTGHDITTHFLLFVCCGFRARMYWQRWETRTAPETHNITLCFQRSASWALNVLSTWKTTRK